MEDSSPSINIQVLEQEYRLLAPVAEHYCEEMKHQLERLLEDQGITLGFPIQYRVKQWDSMAEKLNRIQMKITGLREIQDISGLRLILLFKRDVDKVCTLLTEHFKIVRQYDTQERLAEDQFGYSSIHFIIELPEEWLTVPSLTRFRGMKAEIQVRTLAQHIWAAVSHTLQYKQEAGIPPSVRRAIHRASALLETIDLEFERVLEERQSYRDTLGSTSSNDILNVDLLEKTLDSLLPLVNKDENENYAELLSDLLHFNISTPSDLKELIEKHMDKIIERERELVPRMREELKDNPFAKALMERLNKGAFLAHGGMTRVALQNAVGKNTYDEYRREKMNKKRSASAGKGSQKKRASAKKKSASRKQD